MDSIVSEKLDKKELNLYLKIKLIIFYKERKTNENFAVENKQLN